MPMTVDVPIPPQTVAVQLANQAEQTDKQRLNDLHVLLNDIAQQSSPRPKSSSEKTEENKQTEGSTNFPAARTLPALANENSTTTKKNQQLDQHNANYSSYNAVNPAQLTFNDVPAACLNYVSNVYHLSPLLLVSLLKTENGYNGLARRNQNGSYDYGPAQINSWWLPYLKHFGIDQHALQFNPCINIDVGAWILAQEISKSVNFAEAIGNYNSHTPVYNQRYAFKVLNWQRYFQNGLNQ